MRLWFINFDGTIVPETKNRTAACLDSSCETVLRSLSEHVSDQVVIVSSRSLDDIAGRIAIPGAILGGCNGIEWQLPSGYRIGAFRDHEEDLKHIRTELVSGLYDIISGQGVEIEDKLWSIAVHAEKISHTAWRTIVRKVSLWAMQHGVLYYCRPDEIDVQMIRGFNRSVGISYLVRQFNIDPIADSVLYVGHDEGDVAALWWTKFFGGTAIVVGDEITVSGALHVKNCSGLATKIRELALEL
jgi:trehalose 6-phosphate phosphatase